MFAKCHISATIRLLRRRYMILLAALAISIDCAAGCRKESPLEEFEAIMERTRDHNATQKDEDECARLIVNEQAVRRRVAKGLGGRPESERIMIISGVCNATNGRGSPFLELMPVVREALEDSRTQMIAMLCLHHYDFESRQSKLESLIRGYDENDVSIAIVATKLHLHLYGSTTIDAVLREIVASDKDLRLRASVLRDICLYGDEDLRQIAPKSLVRVLRDGYYEVEPISANRLFATLAAKGACMEDGLLEEVRGIVGRVGEAGNEGLVLFLQAHRTDD